MYLATASRSRFTLTDTGVFNFVVSGLSNNVITGAGIADINGIIKIDTSAATMVLNTSWTLINPTTKSFGATFAVDGYNNLGGGIWSNGQFEFSTLTGALTLAAVPEPSAFAALAGLAGLGFAGLRRRRRA